MAWRRPLRQLLFWGLTGSLISLAVLLALVQLALPWWASNPDRVARLLSARLGSPVEIEATRPYWSAGGPIIELHGVRFGVEGSAEIASIERAAWAIDFSGLVRRSRPISEFRIHGLDLTVARGDEGSWQVLGLPALLTGDSQPLAQSLHALPSLSLRDSRLVLREAPHRPERVFLLRELRRIDTPTGTQWRGQVALDEVEDTDRQRGELLLALDLRGGHGDRLYVAGDALDLGAWIGRLQPLASQPRNGRLSVEAWIGFDRRGVHDAQLEWRQSESLWHVETDGDDTVEASSTLTLPELEIAVRWQRLGEDGSRLLVEHMRVAGADAGRLFGHLDGDGGWLRASGLDVAVLVQLATVTGRVPATLRQWLDEARPRGRIEGLDVFLSAQGRPQRLAANLDGLAFDAAEGQPGLQGLGLRLRADRNGLVAWPKADEIVLDAPNLFKAPLRVRPESGAIVAWQEDQDDGWWLSMDQLALSGEGFRALAAGGLRWRDGEALFMDLGAHVYDSQVEAANALWPINRAPNTSRWLGRALRGGRLVRGDAWIRGYVGDFPFDGHSGRFEATADVEQAGLRFHEDWPALSGIAAELGFVNNSMRIRGERLTIAGVAVTGSTAEVDDMSHAVLRVRGQARAAGERLFALVEASPMQGWFGEHLRGMALEGQPRVNIDLVVPLQREADQQVQVDGRIEFSGERFTDSRWNLDFEALEGTLRFDRDGLGIDDLQLRVAGEPARMELRVGSHTRVPDRMLEARMDGWLSADAVFGGVEGLAPVLRRTRGRANWVVEVEQPTQGAGGRIRLESDLRGIALALPAPLTKAADSVLPLSLEAGTDADSQPLRLRLGHLLNLRAQLPGVEQPFAGSVALGGASPEQLPARGLIVTGQVPALDLSGWLALGRPEDGAAVSSVGTWPRVLLRAGELGVLGRRFQDVDLQVRPGQGQVEMQLRGPQIEGEVLWPLSTAERVRGRFRRLHLPGGDEQALGDGLAPGSMPDLDVEADDLRVGDSRLGRARLIAAVEGERYRIETFSTRSPAFEMDASGDWQRLGDGDRSRLSVQLRADDLGAMLESFGFAGLVRGGRTVAGIEGHWAGSPAAFSLERIDGRLDLNVGAGRIVDVDPGVGRLFGLLNLREIPRRLILDFRDFFSQGLRFNSIEGSFRLDVGDAWTDDLVLRSSAADILITGRTGLAARDYDQTVEVTPRLGGTLPVVGAIAGGPAGAAAGLVMQGLLRIDEANRTIYRVTGNWDEPDIVKQEPEPEPPRRRSGTRTSKEQNS